MLNYFKNLWTGALLHPARWLYTSEKPEVVCGIMISLASFLFLFFTFALVSSLLTLIIWGYAVIRPDRYYVISSDDKNLYITLFRTGKKDINHKADQHYQTALMRSLKLLNHNSQLLEKKSQKIFGYDDLFSGLFLFKTTAEDWTLVSGKYFNTLFIGRQMKDNLYMDNTNSHSPATVTLLHGNTAVRFEVTDVDYFPHYTYDKNKAVYHPVASCAPDTPDFDVCKKVVFEYRGRKKLFFHGISGNHQPMAFQVRVPFIYKTKVRRTANSSPIPLSPNDWSFAHRHFYE